MGIEILYSKKIENKLKIKCPSCGNDCAINDLHCDYCSYDLSNYRNIILSCFKYYNDAIDFCKKNNYLEAYVSISQFNAFYKGYKDARKLYIYILYKNQLIDKYNVELEKFEDDFFKDPWIMQIEKEGIESFQLPDKFEETYEYLDQPFPLLNEEYLKDKYKTTNDLIEFALKFYQIVRLLSKNTNNGKLMEFYNKEFNQFLSKKEISLEYNDGKNINDLSNEELGLVDIITEVNDDKLPNGLLTTIQPMVKLRSKIISKEKVICIRNTTESSNK